MYFDLLFNHPLLLFTFVVIHSNLFLKMRLIDRLCVNCEFISCFYNWFASENNKVIFISDDIYCYNLSGFVNSDELVPLKLSLKCVVSITILIDYYGFLEVNELKLFFNV